MSKSKRPLRPKIDLEGFTDTGLPTPEKVTRMVADATGQKTFTPADLEGKRAKPRGPETKKGRVKLTTMLHPELREQLETLAKARGITLADVLEIILTEYLADLKKTK